MRVQRWGWLALVVILLSGCATTHTHEVMGAKKQETDTERGVRYLLGRGVEQSNEQAFYYFSQAADEEDPLAQNEVAYLYASGKGTSQNYNKAFKYYMKAANQGLASAQYNVGFFYLHGLSVPVDTTMAKTWFEKSAASGFEPARSILETMD